MTFLRATSTRITHLLAYSSTTSSNQFSQLYNSSKFTIFLFSIVKIKNIFLQNSENSKKIKVILFSICK